MATTTATVDSYEVEIPQTVPDFEAWPVWPDLGVPEYPDEISEPGFIPDDEPGVVPAPERQEPC